MLSLGRTLHLAAIASVAIFIIAAEQTPSAATPPSHVSVATRENRFAVEVSVTSQNGEDHSTDNTASDTESSGGTGGSSTTPAAPRIPTRLEWTATMDDLGECDGPAPPGWCAYPWPTDPDTTADPTDTSTPVTPVDIDALALAIAHQATLTLELPTPTINLGPDPTDNEWNMAVVGYPLWVWTDTPDTITSTVTQSGITINLNATRTNTTYDFGDGTTITCTTTSPLPTTYQPGDPSPTCGHTYQDPEDPVTITATSTWTFHWNALGRNGTLPGHATNTRTIKVGELQAILIPNNP